MSKKLDGKVAVITGGSAGIGLGTAKRFAAEGARVFITGRRETELSKAASEIGHGETFDTNVRGLFFCVQKVLPLLSADASVILNGSIASIKGIPAFSVYNETKAAVRSFARSWILDLKGTGVRVNVLSPGHTDTPGLSSVLTDDEKAGVVAQVTLKRLGTPDDLSRAAVFLASDDSGYVTGIELFVDGGVAQY